MFIGHYKSVSGSGEFYSSLSESLNLPMQIFHNGENYLLDKTYQIPSQKFMENIIRSAKNFGIDYNIQISSTV
jgi:hypothetical protein